MGLFLATALAIPACSSVTDRMLTSTPAEGAPGHVSGFLGGVVADEPRAALAAREVLSAGGTAADAAVALGFALAVTYPSRAGLGGGGACLAYSPAAAGPKQGGTGGDHVRPARACARGERGPARRRAVSRARPIRPPCPLRQTPVRWLVNKGPADGAVGRSRVARLRAGPFARVRTLVCRPYSTGRVFPNGVPLAEGDRLVQPDLGATIAHLRLAGVGDFYTGALARRLVEGAPLAGASFSLEDLRGTLPRAVPPLSLPNGRDTVAFLPPPADGGLAAAGAFTVLQDNPAATDKAKTRALALAARWRAVGGDPQALLATDPPPAPLPELPASTTFLTLDRDGNAVACALTMNNLFGTGRTLPGTGMLLAGSPAAFPPPLLAAAVAWNRRNDAFRAAVGGSGQAGAPVAAALALLNALRGNQPMPEPVPDPGRANVIACSRYLPGSEASCGWATDARGAGLAIGSN